MPQVLPPGQAWPWPPVARAGMVLTSRGGGTGVKWVDPADASDTEVATFPAKSSFVWSGAVVIPSGGVGDINPDLIYVPPGLTFILVQVFAIIGSGTSATIALRQNGSSISGLTAMSVVPYSSVSAMTYTPSGTITIANGDRINPLVTAVSGSPVDFSVVACYSVSQAL
jgi:hypothetical protein